MAEYDQIGENRAELGPEVSYNGQNYEQVRSAFQYACRTCNAEVALRFALEAYFTGGDHRKEIITTLFMVTFEDKGLANTMLFTQVFQLMIPLFTREWDERPLEEKLGPEDWKVISDYNKYEISSLGRVRKKKETKLLRITKRGGYNYVTLDLTPVRVDFLVGEAFVKRKKEGDTILEHLDNDLTNDVKANLYWVSMFGRRPAQKEEFVEFRYIKKIKYDNLDRNPDRLSYIYRFALAVWLIALSPTTRVNAWATIIYHDVAAVNEDDNEAVTDYIERFGNCDNCREDLFEALTDKNMAECLRCAKILHYHPQPITLRTFKWARSRDEEGKIERINHACVYIWDGFTKVASKVAHVIPYLESMRSLAMTEAWRYNDRSRLLYAHFIHMWCMDPITAYADMKRDTRTLVWGEQKIVGSFSRDFRVKGPPAKILGKWSSLAVVDTDEPVLFPINYTEFFEPMMPHVVEYEDPETKETISVVEKDLRYTDPTSGQEIEIPNFNSYFQQVIDGTTDKIPKAALHKNMALTMDLDDRNMHLIYYPAVLVNEDPKWRPLSAFYAFFRFYGENDITEELEKIYGTAEDFFTKEGYPNPLEEKIDLTKTEFLSFQPKINAVIGVEGEVKPYINLDPERRKMLRSRSTFFYRAIPSPVKKAMPAITITHVKRESPLKLMQTTPSTEGKMKPRMATERVRTKEPSPMPSPYQKSPKEETSSQEEETSTPSEASHLSRVDSETEYSTEPSSPSEGPVSRSPVPGTKPKRRSVRIRVQSFPDDD